MDSALWIAVGVVAIGTFAMRALPYVWMRRHLARRKTREATEAMPAWLVVLGPAMISAMFGVSLAPASNTPGAWLATLCGVLLTLAVWLRTKSLSWPVFAGVAMYGLVIFLAQ